MSLSPMIVVGTTPDYVVRILNKVHPDPILFILDSCFTNDSLLADLDRSCLLFTDMENYDATLSSLTERLAQDGASTPTFSCFDCESLVMASRLSDCFKSRFPSIEAILLTRSKFLSREVWRKAGLDNPRAVLASDVDQTLRCFHEFKRDIVLKPISGSGSELVFRCIDEAGVRESVSIIKEQLQKRRHNPLFRPIQDPSASETIDPCKRWVVEEYVSGQEFSCDFILHEGRVHIVREAGKIKADDQTFGSVMAYTMPAVYPETFSREELYSVFLVAARSLGYDWGHFMVDFIIRKDSAVILEMTPRPSGDSIPDLLGAATGRDILTEYMDFMAGRFDASRILRTPTRPYASINFFIPASGIITELDVSEVMNQPGTVALFLKKNVGDRVTLPPDDYDNRLLGHCIMHWDYGWDQVAACRCIQGLLKVSVKNAQTGAGIKTDRRERADI
ncbi:MAG TPA: ATP-grasp domain-containing protein [Desulfatiglandales bacterium]|nr:ATP-grasp domain-containing protein [Desulfatiglandales bacterium]